MRSEAITLTHAAPDASADVSRPPENAAHPFRIQPHLAIQPLPSALQSEAKHTGNVDGLSPGMSSTSRIASGTLANVFGSSDTHPHPAASQICID